MKGAHHGRFRHNAGGMKNAQVCGGTIRPSSYHPARHKRGGSGVNSGKGPGGSRASAQNSHAPKGSTPQGSGTAQHAAPGKPGKSGRGGKTDMTIARQRRGARRPYPM